MYSQMLQILKQKQVFKIITFAQNPGNRRQAFKNQLLGVGRKSRLKFYAVILQLAISVTEGIVQSYFPTIGKKMCLEREGIFSLVSDPTVIYRFCFTFFQL